MLCDMQDQWVDTAVTRTGFGSTGERGVSGNRQIRSGITTAIAVVVVCAILLLMLSVIGAEQREVDRPPATGAPITIPTNDRGR